MLEPLIQVVREKGGDVIASTRARRIVVEDNRARGIIVENKDGEMEISAKLIISNAGPKKTVELAGRENFEKSYLVALRDQIRQVTAVTTCAAVDKDLLDFSGVVIYGSNRRMILMVCPTLTCPDLAPKGKHLLVSYSVPQFTMGPLKLRETFDLTMEDYRENYPDFDKHGEVLMWDSFYGDWPVYHSWPGYDLPQRTPIRNLINVGDGVKPLGWSGLESVAECGRLVAEDAIGLLE
jgi:phytoene dehydrogenase-like protein